MAMNCTMLASSFFPGMITDEEARLVWRKDMRDNPYARMHTWIVDILHKLQPRLTIPNLAQAAMTVQDTMNNRTSRTKGGRWRSRMYVVGYGVTKCSPSDFESSAVVSGRFTLSQFHCSRPRSTGTQTFILCSPILPGPRILSYLTPSTSSCTLNFDSFGSRGGAIARTYWVS